MRRKETVPCGSWRGCGPGWDPVVWGQPPGISRVFLRSYLLEAGSSKYGFRSGFPRHPHAPTTSPIHTPTGSLFLVFFYCLVFKGSLPPLGGRGGVCSLNLPSNDGFKGSDPGGEISGADQKGFRVWGYLSCPLISYHVEHCLLLSVPAINTQDYGILC